MARDSDFAYIYAVPDKVVILIEALQHKAWTVMDNFAVGQKCVSSTQHKLCKQTCIFSSAINKLRDLAQTGPYCSSGVNIWESGGCSTNCALFPSGRRRILYESGLHCDNNNNNKGKLRSAIRH